MDQTTNDPTFQPHLRFRSITLRRGVFLTWIVLVALIAQAVRIGEATDRTFLLSASAFVVLLALGGLANWEKLLGSVAGGYLTWAWTVLLTLALASLATIPGMYQTVVPLFAGIVVLTGLALTPIRHIFVSILTGFVIVLAALLSGELDALESIVTPVLTVGVVAAATGVIGSELEKESKAGAEHLKELQEQRADFERLYAVSATLASAESLAEGLPQIVGTVCRYLDAQVGIVFLHSADDHTLKVMNPMWVNGYTLETDDLKIPISGGGILPQVFRSGRPMRLEHVTSNIGQFGVIAELGLTQALVAPLRVEGHNVGVIVVGDPHNGSFRDEQLEDLASLGAPAALVLSQLGRYEAAAEMTRRMREIAQMKTDFVSVVSHELRTPLTSIIGSLDTVVRPELSADVAKDLITSARRQASRLQRLIEDLLIVSRIDRHAVPVSPEPISMVRFLDETVSTVHGIEEISVSVDPPDLTIFADHDHLGRVFINLIENAVKYAPGSPVEIKALQVGSRVEIDVIDHGAGIPADQRERIFERFTQIESSDTRTRGGTGLGLSIVKGLVEAMNGQVAVSETPGGGATFTVNLPPASVSMSPGLRSA